MALCWLHALLMPRRLVFKGSNIHAKMRLNSFAQPHVPVELNEMKNRREKGKKMLWKKDLRGAEQYQQGSMKIPRSTQEMIPVKHILNDGTFVL